MTRADLLARIEAECYHLDALELEATQPSPPLRILTEQDVRLLMADRIDAVCRTVVA